MRMAYYWLKDLELVGRLAQNLKESDYDKAGKAIVPYHGLFRNGAWDESREAQWAIHGRLAGFEFIGFLRKRTSVDKRQY